MFWLGWDRRHLCTCIVWKRIVRGHQFRPTFVIQFIFFHFLTVQTLKLNLNRWNSNKVCLNFGSIEATSRWNTAKPVVHFFLQVNLKVSSLCTSSTGESYEFIPLEWLKKWLDDSTATKEIDNAHFLCSHGKLHLDKVAESKRVSAKAARLLFERYGGGPRLDGEWKWLKTTVGSFPVWHWMNWSWWSFNRQDCY